MLPKNNLEHNGKLVISNKFERHGITEVVTPDNYLDCTPDCPACAYEQGQKDEAARWLEHIEGQREKIAEYYWKKETQLEWREYDEIQETKYWSLRKYCLFKADQIIALFKEVQ